MLDKKTLIYSFILPLMILLAACCFYLFYGIKGNWSFIVGLRANKLALLLLVAYMIGMSTLLFQTLTNNNILTPSILGFDVLYVLMQTILVFLLGNSFVLLNIYWKFSVEALIMVGASIVLFRTLNRYSQHDLTKMILIGVIMATFLRSINSLLQRLIDPTVFAIAQTRTFASFTSTKPELLTIGGIIALLSFIWIWQQRHRLDVLMLGKNLAITLGIEYRQFSIQILTCMAILVSVATALVGPISFFGLLVCTLVNILTPSMQHSVRIPFTFLISALILVLGQLLFEQALGMKGVLGVVIEFIGGLTFLALVLKKRTL
ncbi:iron chelate uptake ABC transporter family permease subunit [Basilea psittacipulmonis]|uniref:Iron ABC transporter permease n=1 Tax=Basilea psittacipulmonis DSM 24701 TaxID=1072685 RepID=A0A077DG93_9BURK|nr:iron chelate uptake ABC transporter family permease subunit [Basilea psittacipulmonis]AIL32173.1 iron ABC transporter permease [Basilea psittacipulmonis DSM 24701]